MSFPISGQVWSALYCQISTLQQITQVCSLDLFDLQLASAAPWSIGLFLIPSTKSLARRGKCMPQTYALPVRSIRLALFHLLGIAAAGLLHAQGTGTNAFLVHNLVS